MLDWSDETCFRRHADVRILAHPEQGSFARLGQRYAQLSPGPYRALLEELAQARTLRSLSGAPRAALSNAALRWQLQQLVEEGYVQVEAAGQGHGAALSPSATAPGHGHGPREEGALERGLREALRHAGLAGLRLVVLDHYLGSRGLTSLLEPSHDASACLPVALFEGQLWLGPALGRPGGPCPQCLHDRLWQNHPIERLLFAHGVGWEVLFPSLPPVPGDLEHALDWIRRRLSARLSSGSGTLSLYTVDLRSGREEQHGVDARPQCPRSGDRSLLGRQMLAPPSWLAGEPSGATDRSHSGAPIVSRDGGLRTVDPEGTFRRLSSHVDPLLGRVGSLVHALDKSNAHHQVFAATYHRCPRPEDARALQDFGVLAGGKGRSPVQARTSALCEALERQCAQFEGDEARRSGSYESLAPDAIDPRSLLLFSEGQYRAGTPERLRAHASPRSQHVPAPFDPTQVMDFSPVWSLPGARRRWVPSQYCFDGAPSSGQPAPCAWDSNGCAAGNTLAEATLQGLCELIERDAIAIWWYNRLSMPGLSLEQGLSSSAACLIERHMRARRRCWALDLTHDLGVPVAAALLEDPASGGLALGFGCHPSADIALERAVLELEQVQEPRLFFRSELEHERYLLPTPGRAVAPRLDFSASAGPAELERTLATTLERVCAAGLEPLLLDYSRPDVALHTVKVMVPGLRHFWPRYAPGRLYQVPLQMGWLARPLAEAALNPVPLLM